AAAGRAPALWSRRTRASPARRPRQGRPPAARRGSRRSRAAPCRSRASWGCRSWCGTARIPRSRARRPPRRGRRGRWRGRRRPRRARRGWTRAWSEGERRGRERLPQRPRAVDVLEAPERREAGQAGHQDDVVDQQRPVAEPEAVVDARLVADAPLEENELERARLLEADVVHVELAEELGGELAGEPGVVEEEPRVHEVGLPLVLAAA